MRYACVAACFTILLLFCEHAYQVTFLPVVIAFVDVCPVVGNGIVEHFFVIAVAIRGVVFVYDIQYVAFGVPGECFFLSVPVVPSCAVGIEAIQLLPMVYPFGPIRLVESDSIALPLYIVF